jgi:N-acetylglucosamine kinase-like BadF-type ATPase
MKNDTTGQFLGFGEGGPGNHESVGYTGLVQVMVESTRQAMQQARLSVSQIAGGLGRGCGCRHRLQLPRSGQEPPGWKIHFIG